jgi:hypothetical protein
MVLLLILAGCELAVGVLAARPLVLPAGVPFAAPAAAAARDPLGDRG